MSVVRGAWILVPLVLVACASPPGLPPPPSAAEREAFGPVCVVVSDGRPSVDVAGPATGLAGGFESGLSRGVSVTQAMAPVSMLALAGGLLVTPLFVVSESIAAPSAREVEAAGSVVRPIVEDPALHGRFAACVEEAMRQVAGVGPSPAGEAGTQIEVRVASVEMHGTTGEHLGQRDFWLLVRTSVRVSRVSDGITLYEATLADGLPDQSRRFADWAADDGVHLREALDTLLRRLARGAVEEVFLVDRALAAQREEFRM